MADEIRVVASIEVENGNFSFPRISQQRRLYTQQAAGGGVPGGVNVDEEWEQVDLSELTTPGWVYLANTSDSVSVEYDREAVAGSGSGGSGSGSGDSLPVAFGLLRPREVALFRLGVGSLYMRTLSGSALVQVFAMED